jgi:hypothetical protein
MAARPHVIDGGQFASFRRRIAIASRIGKSFDAARAALRKQRSHVRIVRVRHFLFYGAICARD